MSVNNKFNVARYISRYVKSKYFYYYSDDVVAELLKELSGYKNIKKTDRNNNVFIESYHNYSLSDIMDGKLDYVIDEFLRLKFEHLKDSREYKFNELLELLLEEYEKGIFSDVLTLPLTDDIKEVICLLNDLDTIDGYKVFNDDYIRILFIKTIKTYYEDSLLRDNFQLDMDDFKNKLGIIVKSYVYVDDKGNIVDRDNLFQKMSYFNNDMKRPLNNSTLNVIVNIYFFLFCKNYKFSDFEPIKKDNFLYIVGLINKMVNDYCDELFQIDGNHVLYKDIHNRIANKYLFGEMDVAKILSGKLNKELLEIYSKMVINYQKKNNTKKVNNMAIKYNGKNVDEVIKDSYRRMPKDIEDERVYIYTFILDKYNIYLDNEYVDYFSEYIRRIDKNATSNDVCNGYYDKYLVRLIDKIIKREDKNNINNSSNRKNNSSKKKPVDYRKRIVNYIKDYLIKEIGIEDDRVDLDENVKKIFDRLYRRYDSIDSMVVFYNDVVVNHKHDDFIRNLYIRVFSDTPDGIEYRKKSKKVGYIALGLISTATLLIVMNAFRTGRIMEAERIIEMLGGTDLSKLGVSVFDTNTPGMLMDYFRNLWECGDNYWLMFLSEAEKLYSPEDMNELLKKLYHHSEIPNYLKKMMVDSHGYVSYDAWMKNACEMLDKKLPAGIDTEIFQNYCLKNPGETGTLVGVNDVDVNMLEKLKNIYTHAMSELRNGFTADIDNIKEILETARSIIFKGSDYVGRRLG